MGLDAFGQADGARCARVGQHHRELVSAKSGHNVRFSGVDPKNLANLNQSLAPRQMPMPVVHILDPIEVQEQER